MSPEFDGIMVSGGVATAIISSVGGLAAYFLRRVWVENKQQTKENRENAAKMLERIHLVSTQLAVDGAKREARDLYVDQEFERVHERIDGVTEHVVRLSRERSKREGNNQCGPQ